MPGLPKPTLLDKIKGSCAEALQNSTDVSINDEAVQQLASALDIEQITATQAAPGMPFKFDDLKAEVTIIALLSLLDFGSGYDDLLLEKNKRDAKETMQFGVIGMYISQGRLDHHRLKAFSAYDVHNIFGIEAMVDSEVMPGVTMSRPGPLQPLAQAIRSTLTDTGAALEAAGSTSLGHHILTVLDDLSASGHPPSAADLLEELTDSIPGFADGGLVAGKQVAFQRKALNLVAALHARFADEDKRFDFPDVGLLPADSGSTVAAALQQRGVLQYSAEVAEKVAGKQELPLGETERRLRAAAVVAAERVAAAAGVKYSGHQLSLYLRSTAEEDEAGQLGQLQKHVTKCTAY